MAASLFAFVAAAILGRSWAEASRGFEPRSLDSESRVLTVTPRGHMLSKATPLQSIHEHVISIITHRFAIFAQPPLWDMILPSIPYSCQSRVFSPHGGIPPHMGVWRNGSASDSRSEGWEFESLWPHLRRGLSVARPPCPDLGGPGPNPDLEVWQFPPCRGYGATAARLTPDQKVGSSNLSGLMTMV